MEEKKPYLAVLVIQSIYAGYFLLTKLAFDVGMNTYVFVFYRQAAATVVLAPIAMFFQRSRKTAPPLSFSILLKIFLLSLFGITMSLDVVGVALKYTSASLGAATANTLPVITFFLAVLLRMEKVNIRTSPGMMKVAGVSFCMAGVATIAFYRGPLLKLLLHHHLISNHLHQVSAQVPSTGTWIKGVFLMLLSNITWSFWLVLQACPIIFALKYRVDCTYIPRVEISILQGRVLKSYPSKLLMTTLQCFLSTIQSFVVAVIFARDPIQWKLGWNIRLLSIAYCGIVVTGVAFYMQAWVIEKKGPVFLAMTTPLIMVITIIISAFILGEIISLGSVLGALLLVGGLYCVLWGKTKEEERAKGEFQPTGDIEKECGESKGEIASYGSNINK